MLTPQQLAICQKTISSNAFLCIVMDALERKADLSVVRAADGEKKLLKHCAGQAGVLEPFGEFTAEWLAKYGCTGIGKGTLATRIIESVTGSTYFAPSISGITMPSYDVYGMFPARDHYVDNFFPNLWNEQQKIDLFKKAGKVLFIHGNRGLADAMQNRAKTYYGVQVSYVQLTKWDQAESVIMEANLHVRAPLTIFSAGPASKLIGPMIAGVTLDIGAAAVRWTFSEEFERRKAKAKELGRYDEYMQSPYEFDFGK
jgi:hypothetical protein